MFFRSRVQEKWVIFSGRTPILGVDIIPGGGFWGVFLAHFLIYDHRFYNFKS
jgi:hypothetical protein